MHRRWLSALALSILSCTARRLEPPRAGEAEPTAVATPEAEAERSTRTRADEPMPSADAGSVAVRHEPRTEPQKTGTAPPPPACPGDMALVDGEYCSEVEQTCEQSWYDKANRKKICARFREPSKCIGERSVRRFCIDRYEWPNQAGQRPEVMNTFYQAQVKCAAVGKRLCTESEWTLACEGPDLEPYPYGYVRDANKCNGDRFWDNPDMNKVARRDPAELARLWQGVPSGSQPECVSDYGVFDLPGNADEVVASENFSETWRGRYDSVTTGGPWYRGVRNQCRPKIYTHAEGFYYYYLGFRCCSEADGKATDPRTPKQIRAETPFSTVERLARFSVEEMRQKLELRAKGECTCPARDILCKTMCGSLLGPNARDAERRQAD